MKPPLIQFENVSKRFDTLEVLRGVELSVFQGEVTAIIGKSGEGKSVLLKHMIGLMLPDAGEIFFNGRPLSKMKRSETNRLWEKFSYVFQDAALFDFMTVGDNIAFPLQQGTSLPKADMRKRVQDKLQLFELQEFQDKYPSQISGGMKRRVALARALVTDPEVVLLDEPTTGLDPIRTNAVYSMIVDFQKNFGFTAVMISHQIPDIFYFSNRIAMLDEGRIRFEGTPEEILHFPDPTVQQFIQGLERPRDALTGMATPVQAEKKVQEKLVHLQRHRIVFSVVMFTVENLAVINEKVGHVAGQTILKNFAAQIKQRLDIADSSSRYSIDRILVVLHNADIDDARTFATRLARELKVEDLIPGKKDADLCVRISAGYAQAEEDSLIKEVLAKAESKDNLYYEIELK
ncbi:MAG: ATP-binding cassette domain-containing protein [Desulfobacterales bacterium]|jgi:phospholipid/cholesterol/gamma-HCH transport system ATP-binding protein